MTFDINESIQKAGGDTVVGAAVGKSAATVNRWRTGKRVPSPDDQPALAKALGVDLDTFAGWCARKAELARCGEGK